MDITTIPFAKHIGIKREEENILKLEPTDVVQNHMQTIHASAQFTLAETQSGVTLQKTFPELENKVVALLRGSRVKFKCPATTTLVAHAHIDTERKEKFLSSLDKRGRATITIDVKLLDISDVPTMLGSYDWYIYKL